MTTKEDAEVMRAIKSAVCCPCNSARMFLMGTLFGTLVVWGSTIAGLYIAKQLEGAALNATSVAATAITCPAPVIDMDKLAQTCMDFHSKPKPKR